MIESTLKDASILLVDDNQSNIDVLEGLLEESGYKHFKSTTDPRLAVGLFKSFTPDLILLDLMMPHLSGFDIMNELNLIIPHSTYLPILVLTADITPEARQRALSGGAKDFLSKPFDLYEVRLRIKNLLETRYLYQRLENQNQILEEKVKERTFDLEKAFHELDHANKELKALDQAKLDFLRLISHEIRTPLNGIKGFTDILKSEIHVPELLEYLKFLEISAVRLENFSYQALMITELRTNKAQIEIEEVPVFELFNHANILLQEVIRSKKINVILQNDSAFHVITGNGKFLQICFDRLIDNAVKYSPPDEVVIVKVYSEKEFIVCEFNDNGPGFSPAALHHLYDLFAVGDEHIDKNTGLNLALIKLIMDAHHGQIEVCNNKQGGAMVKLTFINKR
ncbi:MAG: response regulator [Bacteroidetes bacterium]|nr:response regulator [Bacteroidota bacterium]